MRKILFLEERRKGKKKERKKEKENTWDINFDCTFDEGHVGGNEAHTGESLRKKKKGPM